MMNKNIIIISLLVAMATILSSGYILKRIFLSQYYSNIVLAENTLISSDCKEIDTHDLVKIKKDNHFISIVLEPPLEPDTPKGGIKTPAGEIINPEIKLIDENGNEYLLTYSGSRRKDGNEMANYEYKINLPADRTYSKLLIRSDSPIKAKQILWSGYDTKDLP